MSEQDLVLDFRARGYTVLEPCERCKNSGLYIDQCNDGRVVWAYCDCSMGRLRMLIEAESDEIVESDRDEWARLNPGKDLKTLAARLSR